MSENIEILGSIPVNSNIDTHNVYDEEWKDPKFHFTLSVLLSYKMSLTKFEPLFQIDEKVSYSKTVNFEMLWIPQDKNIIYQEYFCEESFVYLHNLQ